MSGYKKIKITFAILTFLVLIFYFFFFRATKLELVKVYHSPDKAYSIEVYLKAKTNSLAKDWARSGSHKSGIVTLRSKKGTIIMSETCDSVGMIEDVWWMDDSISIRGYDVWTYPTTHHK